MSEHSLHRLIFNKKNIYIICLFIQGRRLLVIATSSNRDVIHDMGMDKSFDSNINIPCLSTADHICTALEVSAWIVDSA